MILTNKYNLPEAFVNSVKNHEHKGGWISASQMTKTIRQFYIIKRHEPEIIKDVSELVWSAFGTAFHLLMENNSKNGMTEKYLEYETQGITLTGTTDLYNEGKRKVTDYKTASVWKIVYGDHLDWEVHLNTYAFLLRKYTEVIEEIEVCAFLRDWIKTKADGKNYPPVQIVTVPLKLWSFQEQDEKINKKIEVLLKHKDTTDDNLPACPDNKLWKGKDGLYRACGYCDGRQFCLQYEELKKQNLIKE
jgi:hypothetical protein